MPASDPFPAPEERMPEMQALYTADPVDPAGPALTRAILFPPGRVVMTPGAAQAFGENASVDFLDYLVRHLTGDWGDLDPTDRIANEESLRNGSRLLSSYLLPDGQIIWLITEADRSATTALCPEEY